jgi:CarD family transcriptional regulator
MEGVLMFEIGDAVVHPTRGGGVVMGIEELQRRGESERYYEIKLLSQVRSTLMIPVKRADEVGLRPATPQSEISRVWAVLRADPEALPDDHRDRKGQLEQILRTGDVIKLAETVRDLGWRKKREDGLTIGGRRIFKRAIKLLASEIAATENSALKESQIRIKACLRKSLSSSSAPTAEQGKAGEGPPICTAWQKGKTWLRQALDGGGSE